MPEYTTAYMCWYFGSALELARAIGTSVRIVRAWGELVPTEYHEKINKVLEGDACEKTKKTKAAKKSSSAEAIKPANNRPKNGVARRNTASRQKASQRCLCRTQIEVAASCTTVVAEKHGLHS